MKNWIQPLLIFLAAFGGGLVCALFLSYKLESHSWEEFQALRDSPRIEADAKVGLHLTNIWSAQKGDTDAIIRNNCVLLRATLPLVNPNVYENPEKQVEVKAKIRRAQETINLLTKSGLCQRAL
jgi:hypothetical protein